MVQITKHRACTRLISGVQRSCYNRGVCSMYAPNQNLVLSIRSL